MAVGLRQRHGRNCRGGRCECSWEAFVYSKRDHKKIRKTFATQAQARIWRQESSVAVRKMLMRAPTAITLAQAGDLWFQGAHEGWIRNRSGDRYKPAAIRAYETAWRLRIKPELGHMRLSDVTRNDVQDVVDKLVANGWTASTIIVSIASLGVIYKRAFIRGEIAVNPVLGLQLPAVRGRRARIATAKECAELLAALPQRDRPVWATAMYAGLRRGELMGLRIEDVDFERGLINVRRGWDTLEGEITPKSGRERAVPINATLRAILEPHIRELPWSAGLVFGVNANSTFNGTPLMKRAARAWEAMNLRRITLHECRHTFASLMIAAGVNAKALSTYMGHATISITLDRYGHLMPGSEHEAARMLDEYLARNAPGSRQLNGHSLKSGTPKSVAEGPLGPAGGLTNRRKRSPRAAVVSADAGVRASA
jgi:integrase